MNQIEKIKRRIEKRKPVMGIDIEARSIENGNSGKLFKLFMGLMTIYALFISLAIYARKDEQATFINSVFNTNINFTNFNKTLNKLLNPRIIENTNEELVDQVVSNDVEYIYLGEDYYSSEGNLMVALTDGVISYVNGKDNSYTVIVEYDNGVRATYVGANEVNVYVNDRVYSNDILGSYNEKIQIFFIKDNKKITYEEVIAFI